MIHNASVSDRIPLGLPKVLKAKATLYNTRPTTLTSYSVSPPLDEGLSGPPGENGLEVRVI